MSFNRTQFRAVIGLLTGHNTLRRQLHILGLTGSPLCRKCGVEEETSAHILCECKALTSFRHVHLGSYFLELEDIKSMSLGSSGTLARPRDSLEIDMGHKGPIKVRPRCIWS